MSKNLLVDICLLGPRGCVYFDRTSHVRLFPGANLFLQRGCSSVIMSP